MNALEPASQFMDASLNTAKVAQVKAAIHAGLLDDHAAVSIVDFDGLEKTVARLKAAFPSDFLHAFAVKSNYYLPILARLNGLGMGAEVAGAGELELAIKAGFSPEMIVFDAPVKSREEIARALSLGVAFNIDNFQEFDRVLAFGDNIQPNAVIGFRVNPQIGAGCVDLSSTATLTSKFGVGLRDQGNRDKIIATYVSNPWLNSVHVHVGSVGCPLELMANGVAEAIRLIEEINGRIGHRQINNIDLGGGLPVNFSSDENTPGFDDYARELARQVPLLFSGKYQATTEFGRAIIAKNAFTLARVEYTKVMGGRHIALTHAGAHNLMRLVFQPDDWARRVTAISADGMEKSGIPVVQDIAGPCCFSGDIIAHQRNLPLLEPQDYVMIHDTGAYCFSNHFMYNALTPDPVYRVSGTSKNDIRFDCISPGQDVDQLLRDYG